MNTSFCTRIVNGSMCGSPDAVQVTKDGFLACRDCRIEVVNSQLLKSDKTMMTADNPTGIYVLVTPQGSLKIGRTTNLYERLQSLHRDKFGGRLQVLAFFQGSYRDEADLHVEFEDFKITDVLGEQYFDVPAIRRFAACVGIDPTGQAAVARYSAYEPTVTPRIDTDYVQAGASACND